MSTKKLVIWLAFLAIFAMAVKPSMDSDSWWHLRAGGWILSNRSVPHVDTFSYTRAGEPWEYPGWLVQAPMALIYRMLGPGGLNLWTAAMVTLTFALVWKTMNGGPFLRAFVVVLAAAASGVYWAARPYLVTFVLAAVYLFLLEKYRREPASGGWKNLAWLPVLMIVWVNSHGGFATGFILVGIYGAAETVRLVGLRTSLENLWKTGEGRRFLELLGVGLLMAAAVCVNPHGPVMLFYPFKTVSISALGEFIQEWQSPDLQVGGSQPFIWLILTLIGALGVSQRRLALVDFLLIVVFLYMAFLAWRNVALFAVVAPMVITHHLGPVLDELGSRMGYRSETGPPSRFQRRLNQALLGVFIIAVAARAAVDFPPERNWDVFRATLPVDAVEYIKAHDLPGRIFNSYNWGAYLLWELPSQPVFIDGRTDLYNDEIIGEWLKIVRAEPGWQTAMDDWGVQTVLIEPTLPLAGQLVAEGWREVYRDPVSVVIIRQEIDRP